MSVAGIASMKIKRCKASGDAASRFLQLVTAIQFCPNKTHTGPCRIAATEVRS